MDLGISKNGYLSPAEVRAFEKTTDGIGEVSADLVASAGLMQRRN
jgi:hypothetical protein